MNKILITGASGFIGSFLVEEALQLGMNTHAGVRATSSKKWLLDNRIQFAEIDFEKPLALRDLLQRENYDYIIHCVGLVKSTSKQDFYTVNCTYLQVLVDQLISSGSIPEKLIFISSLAAYGPADFQPKPMVRNDSEPHPVSNYGRSKLAAERYLQSVKDIPWLIIRPTVVYGPRETELFTVFKLLNNGLELYVGNTPQLLTFIYIKDLVGAIFACLPLSESRRAYFVSDGGRYHADYFNYCIKKILGRKTIKLRLPLQMLFFLASITESISRLRGRYPPFNREKVTELSPRNWDCDARPLLLDSGFKPGYSLEKGLHETILWYKKMDWL